jgi:hypothetical protein
LEATQEREMNGFVMKMYAASRLMSANLHKTPIDIMFRV